MEDAAQMSKASKSGNLCPFKKITVTERNAATGTTVQREKFGYCTGAQCMAYSSAQWINDGKPWCELVYQNR